MKAEDILPDERNQAELNGVAIRKGTVAAFLANAKVWCDSSTDPAHKQAAERDILDAMPALQALGLFEVLSVRNAALRKMITRMHG